MTKRLNPLAPNAGDPLPCKYSREPWTLVECPETGLVYLENPPAYGELEETYAWEKTYEAEKQRRHKEEPVFSKLSDASKSLRGIVKRPRKIATVPLSFLKDAPSERLTMVDIGSGNGTFTAEIAHFIGSELKRKVTPIAIEISKAQAVMAQERLSVINNGYCVQAAALEGLQQIKSTRADLIILSSFLEHEVQPVELLAECRKILSPHGIVIIKVPNFACWNRRVRQEKWCGFRYPDHVNYFTPETLRLTIEKAGLKVARMGLRDRFPLSDNMYAVARLP